MNVIQPVREHPKNINYRVSPWGIASRIHCRRREVITNTVDKLLLAQRCHQLVRNSKARSDEPARQHRAMKLLLVQITIPKRSRPETLPSPDAPFLSISALHIAGRASWNHRQRDRLSLLLQTSRPDTPASPSEATP